MKKTTARNGKVHITFELPAAVDAQAVSLCGEFNSWSPGVHALRPRKDGSRAITVVLDPGRTYRYRYLLDGDRWENDWSADAYVPNEFGTEDSLIVI